MIEKHFGDHKITNCRCLVYHDDMMLELKSERDPRATDGSGGDREGPDLSNWIDAGTGESADKYRPHCTMAYNKAFNQARDRTVKALGGAADKNTFEFEDPVPPINKGPRET